MSVINVNQPVMITGNITNLTINYITNNNNQNQRITTTNNNQRITIRVPLNRDTESGSSRPNEVEIDPEVEVEGTEYDVIHQPQLDAGLELLRLYDETHEHIRWNMLIAHMQSGKTGTYLFVACEALRLRREESNHILATIETVVVFSGNAEIELKKQVKADFNKFVNGAYKRYCMETHGYTERRYNNLLVEVFSSGIVAESAREQRGRFRVIWGAELNSPAVPTENALFIWDESHAAQDKNMRPSKLLVRLGMDNGSGDIEQMVANNLFVLSVSATPFSEFSDVAHEVQMKNRVKLNVGEQYYGLEKIMANGRIKKYDDWKQALTYACIRHGGPNAHRTPKYAIVRALGEKNASAEVVARDNGWDIKYYDQSRKGIRSMDELKQAPSRNTVIIIKGMCRMGKVVPKKHISFVLEASSSALRSKYVSNTDTILQGLLGRMMGYAGNQRTEIYLPSKIVDSDELQRYVDFANDGRRMPTRAANVNVPRAWDPSALYPIIPIRVTRAHRQLDNTNNERNIEADSAYLKESVISAVLEGCMDNYNAPLQTAEIIDKLRTFDLSQIEVRNAAYRTYEGVSERLNDIIDSRRPDKLGSSCGISADGNEIKLYKFPNGDVYIDARTVAGDHPALVAQHDDANRSAQIPKTTKNECFTNEVRL